jgi:hypothetical protein
MSEENLILEVAEDKGLRRLGIDPDGDPLEIYLELSGVLRQGKRRQMTWIEGPQKATKTKNSAGSSFSYPVDLRWGSENGD